MNKGAESAELDAAIEQLAREFDRAAGGIGSLRREHLIRALRMVEAGWNRRCFACANRNPRFAAFEALLTSQTTEQV